MILNILFLLGLFIVVFYGIKLLIVMCRTLGLSTPQRYEPMSNWLVLRAIFAVGVVLMVAKLIL